MEDKNIQLIRDLLIEKINFDAVDESMDRVRDHTDKNKRDFYIFIDSHFRIIIEKIYFEDEDDCQKYKIYLRPSRLESDPETNFKRNLTVYDSDMREDFNIDEEAIIKAYNDTLKDRSMLRYLEFMLNCELVLNHDKSIYSYSIEALTLLHDIRSRERRIIKEGDPKVSLLYKWLKEDFESSQIELKDAYKNE